MRSILVASLCLLFSSLPTQAHIKGSFAETSVCGASAIHQTVVIDDGRQHSISLDQRTCRSDAPIEIGGLTGTEYVAYGVDDVQNAESVDRGYVVGTMKNGDRYFITYQGTATMKGNVPEHLEGTWTFTGGSGSLKLLRGGGTYTAKPTANGVGTKFVIQGSYEMP